MSEQCREAELETRWWKTAVNRVDRATHHCWGRQGGVQPTNTLPSHLITLILSNMMSEMKKDKNSMVCAGICGLLPQAMLKPKVHEYVCELGCHWRPCGYPRPLLGVEVQGQVPYERQY